jgi:uncharacterized protein
MTGLTFKNCDTFYDRVCIYLGCMGLGLSGFLIIGCGQVSADSLSILPLTSLNVISDVSSSPNKNTDNTPDKSLNKLTAIKKTKVTDRAQYLPVTVKAIIADRMIELEVTRNSIERSKGLMFRSTLPDDRGMLFNFNPPQAIGFWMKNVPVPLDMIFIYQNKIVAIAPNAIPCKTEPCTIYPDNPVVADQVIEVRGGLAKEMKLKLGDRVVIEKIRS